MTAVPASVKAYRYAQVNLLPPEVGMRIARGRQRFAALIIIVLIMGLLGVAAYWLDSEKNLAELELAQAEARNLQLQQEIAQYSHVPVIEERLRNVKHARFYTGATEVLFDDFMTDLYLALPDDITFDTLVFSKVSLTSNAGQASGPFTDPDIGSLSFRARTETAVDAAELADALNALAVLQNVRIEVDTRSSDAGEAGGSGGIYYEVTGTARINYAALSGRFTPAWFGEEGLPVEPSAPAAEASTEPEAGTETEGTEGGENNGN